MKTAKTVLAMLYFQIKMKHLRYLQSCVFAFLCFAFQLFVQDGWYFDELQPEPDDFEEPDADSDFDYEESNKKKKKKAMMKTPAKVK